MATNDSGMPMGQAYIPRFDPATPLGDDRRQRSFRERARNWFDWLYEEVPEEKRGPRRRPQRRPPRRKNRAPSAVVAPPTTPTGDAPAYRGAAGASEAELRFALATAEAVRTNLARQVAVYARWLLTYRYPSARRKPLVEI